MKRDFNEIFKEDFNEGLNEIIRKHDLKIKKIEEEVEEIMKNYSMF